ncbi:hypothetical protein GCM10009855_15640 [Gordonia cholesterolivorans]|uniref:Uncharacterized protein n=1 Tax=Gordonia cholesterolivorans TaxID=559625 RepID=A0ABN3HE20_9ACTN
MIFNPGAPRCADNHSVVTKRSGCAYAEKAGFGSNSTVTEGLPPLLMSEATGTGRGYKHTDDRAEAFRRTGLKFVPIRGPACAIVRMTSGTSPGATVLAFPSCREGDRGAGSGQWWVRPWRSWPR